MKKLSILMMAMLAMASCAKENTQTNEQFGEEHQLLEIGLASTKTALGTEDVVNKLFPIVWSEGDEIAVVENMGNVGGVQNVSVYRLKEGVGTSNGIFEHVSGDAFPKVINDVIYPASAVDPKNANISETPITDISALVPKKQIQKYHAENFDPDAAVMHFHRNNADEEIVLSPLSSIVCIPIKGFDNNDVVTAVKWQNMDGRTVDVTLDCPNGVKLSKDNATNFYLSIPPMTKNCNGIAYVYLKNGAVQVKTPRNLKQFEAGTLHRFPVWELGKKAKWSILGIGSERDAATWEQVPLGPAQYMIDGNDLSWWESRRKPNSENSKPVMDGNHTVVIDLGSSQRINGIKIKSKESKGSPEYGIKLNDGSDVLGTQSYNPPHTFYIGFTDKDLGTDAINAFIAKKTWPAGMTKTTFKSDNSKGINFYYGNDKKTWWDNKLTTAVTARYVFIHFDLAWNNDGVKGAAPFKKVAELDIY